MYEYENCIFILKIKLVFSKILKIKPIGLRCTVNLEHLFLKFHGSLKDLSQSDAQLFYGLQIDSGTRQFVSSS